MDQTGATDGTRPASPARWQLVLHRALAAYLPSYLERTRVRGLRVAFVLGPAAAAAGGPRRADTALLAAIRIAARRHPRTAVVLRALATEGDGGPLCLTDPAAPGGGTSPWPGPGARIPLALWIYARPQLLAGCDAGGLLRLLAHHGHRDAGELLLEMDVLRLPGVGASDTGAVATAAWGAAPAGAGLPLTPARQRRLLAAWLEPLRHHLPHVGICPLEHDRAGGGAWPPSVALRWLVFCTARPEALLRLNDTLAASRCAVAAELDGAGTIFAGLGWRAFYDATGLDAAVARSVRSSPGISRKRLVLAVAAEHFGEYLAPDVRGAVDRMVGSGRLRCPTRRRGLTDASQLLPAP